VELILASGSPRRAEILRSLGIGIRVEPPNVPEEVLPGETPEVHAERLSLEKALSVGRAFPGRWVLAGDTVVVAGGTLLGKPRDRAHAVEMLLRLQGGDHRVVSGLALVRCSERPAGSEPAADRQWSGVEVTRVHFRPFGRDLAEAYADTGEPMDKAGGYAIQGRGAVLVTRIEGDYSGVVGLPVPLLVRLLERAGRPYRFGDREG